MNKTHGKLIDGDPKESQFVLEKNGRNFQMFSIHPNSEEWLFTECSMELNPSGDCYVMRYNLSTKLLQRYALPEGFLYGSASFSPQGHYIVMNRAPKHDGTTEKIRQSIENSEIVIMQSDGTNFSVIPIAKGSKLAPFMSKDEKKIAYWRSGFLRSEGNKSMSADFDVYEYELSTKSDHLFAGSHHFFGGGIGQYISDDEILFSSYGPGKYAQSMGAYLNKFNGSEVYKLKRGNIDLPTPSFTNIENAGNPSIDKNGNFYLTGQQPSLGSAFLKISISEKIQYWPELINLALSGFRQVIASPSGQYFAFIYAADGTHYGDQKSAFGKLDTKNSQWMPIIIPSLDTSILLSVQKKRN